MNNKQPLTCFACENWINGQYVAGQLPKHVECKVMGKLTVGRLLRQCPSGSYQPGADQAEAAEQWSMDA